MTDETAPIGPADAQPPGSAPAGAAGSTDVTQPAPAAPGAAPWASAPAADASPAPPAPRGSALGALRSVAVGLVFVLACLALVLATTGWWVNRTFTDTDGFVAAAAPVAERPEVQEALARIAADQVAETLDLGPIGRYVAVGIARELFASDVFVELWDRALRAAHTTVIAVLRDDRNLVDEVDGQVSVNLFPFIDRILERVGSLDLAIAGRTIVVPDITDPSDPVASRAELEAALGRPLSPTFGTLPIARGDRLVAAQQAFAVFELGIVVLGAAAAVLALLAVLLARRRLRMVALLGVGGLAALLAARLAIAALQDAVTDAVTSGTSGAAIVDGVVRALADSYREFTGVVLLVALVAAVVATALAWSLDRRARAAGGSTGDAALADAWFMGIAGLCIALAALILIGLTPASLAIVGLAFVAWLAVVVRARRRGRGASPAAA